MYQIPKCDSCLKLNTNSNPIILKINRQLYSSVFFPIVVMTYPSSGDGNEGEDINRFVPEGLSTRH